MQCTTAAAAPVHACIVDAAWVLAGGVAPPFRGVCPSGPRECPEELPPRFGVCALPDLPARSPKVAPWLDGGPSLSGDPSDSPPKWLLTRCGFTDASDSPPFVAVDTLNFDKCRSESARSGC